MFNFGEELCIWIHSIYFQVKDFWFYGNLTGNIRDLTGFIGPDIFGNEPARQRKKEPANARTCRIHQSHLISGTFALVDITEQTRVYHYTSCSNSTLRVKVVLIW